MKVLLVDDDVTSLEVLQDVMILNDFECDAFSNPVMALEAYQNGKYIAVITDYLMNHFNGIDLMKAIKQKDPSAKVMLYSACQDQHLAELAMTNGAYKFFSKPISWIAIENVLQELHIIFQNTLPGRSSYIA